VEMDFDFQNLRRMICVGVALEILIQIWKIEIRYRPLKVDHRPGRERVVEEGGRNRSQGRATFTIAVFYKCAIPPLPIERLRVCDVCRVGQLCARPIRVNSRTKLGPLSPVRTNRTAGCCVPWPRWVGVGQREGYIHIPMCTVSEVDQVGIRAKDIAAPRCSGYGRELGTSDGSVMPDRENLANRFYSSTSEIRCGDIDRRTVRSWEFAKPPRATGVRPPKYPSAQAWFALHPLR
jgi:hypothetical protein